MGFIAPFIGPIASTVGTLLSGKGDKRETGQQNQAWSQLFGTSKQAGTLGTQQTGAGIDTTRTGLQTLQQPKDYWTNLLSGSRPSQMAAIAPEINAINEMAAAQRAKEGAYGTSRGGGTNVAAQTAETARLSAINNALFGARPEAAKGLESIGRTISDVGLNQLSAGLRAMGLSQEAIQSILSSAGQARGQSIEAHQNFMTNLGKSIGDATGILKTQYPDIFGASPSTKSSSGGASI